MPIGNRNPTLKSLSWRLPLMERNNRNIWALFWFPFSRTSSGQSKESELISELDGVAMVDKVTVEDFGHYWMLIYLCLPMRTFLYLYCLRLFLLMIYLLFWFNTKCLQIYFQKCLIKIKQTKKCSGQDYKTKQWVTDKQHKTDETKCITKS